MNRSRYRLKSDMVFRTEGEESFLFDPETGRVRILNETGTMIYQHLMRNLSREEIIDSIISEYEGVDRRDLEEDLDEFTAQMEQSGIIELIKEIEV